MHCLGHRSRRCAKCRHRNKSPWQVKQAPAIDSGFGRYLGPHAFRFLHGIVGFLNSNGGESYFAVVATPEIGGALSLGLLMGLPASFLTGRIKSGEPILSEAIGIVFLCCGLAIWLAVSHLIAAMAMGAVTTNFAEHHTRPFHAIEGIEWPFMAIFFFLAGHSLEIRTLKEVGITGSAYILARSLGKYLGGRLGSIFSGASTRTQRWVGAALLPQAGVANGMALVASNHYPEYRQALLPIVISSTVLFEIFGPIFTRMAIRKSGEDVTL
jgi:Kef-type K+ transport system membrane component KefB